MGKIVQNSETVLTGSRIVKEPYNRKAIENSRVNVVLVEQQSKLSKVFFEKFQLFVTDFLPRRLEFKQKMVPFIAAETAIQIQNRSRLGLPIRSTDFELLP